MRPRLELDASGWGNSLALEATPWRIGASRRLSVIAKSTVQLVAEGPAHSIAVDPWVGGVTELAPVLPHPQITLVGHAYAPTGTRRGMQPARVALVRGSTTIFDKSILVYGDRASPTDFAQPFDVMPLIHERGPGSGWNPLGRVMARGDAPPNLIPSSPSQPIACFAPIPPDFPARAAVFDPSAIRREGDVLAFGLFDFRWFQDAPFDQWLPPLHGGETLILEGLSPHLPRLATQLPAKLLLATWWHVAGATGRFRLRLERVDVDVDRGVASLVWRGHFALPEGAMPQDLLVRLKVGGTTLADIVGGDDDEGPPTRAHLPRAVLASMADVTRATLADISRATLADVSRATLADVSRATLADIDVVDSSRHAPGPGSSTLPFRGPPPPVAAPTAPTPTPPTAPPAPAPLRSLEELQRDLLGGVLTGDALRAADLGGIALKNADLSGRDLRGARLARASLDGARLSGASLDGADLSGASLRGAALDQASLVGTNLAGADLGQANLSGAKLERAILRESRLHGAVLDDARLDESDLDDADAQGASMDRAVLCAAKLRRARFDRASLREANLDEVDAQDARFVEADLTRSRGARARLPRARFDRARLDEATWPEASLEGASLVDAFLCRAVVTKGSFVRANLTRADLREASMQGALFAGALCDAAAFDRADLSGADLATAHLNEHALVRARTSGAKLR